MIENKYAFSVGSGYQSFPYPDDDKELISRRLKKRIFVSVLVAHIVLIGCPFMWYLLIKWLRPELPKIIKIQIVDLPITGKPPPKGTSPRGKKPSAPKTKEKPSPPKEKSVPKEEPASVKKPVPTPPVEKAPETKVAVKPVETEKAWKPIDISKINITKNVVVKGKTKSAPKNIPQVSAQDILKKIKSQVSVSNVIMADKSTKGLDPKGVGDIGVSTGVDDGTGGIAGSKLAMYYEMVSSYLYKMWKQPGKGLIGNAKPTVDVHVSIDANGRILSSKVIRKSNIGAMDTSIETLLKEVTSLPKPPGGGMEFDITLEISDNQ